MLGVRWRGVVSLGGWADRLRTMFLGAVIISGARATDVPALLQQFYEREYGVEEATPFDKGIFIYDGKYIRSPYILSRKGLTVFLNDIPLNEVTPYASVFQEGRIKGIDDIESTVSNDGRMRQAIEKRLESAQRLMKQEHTMQSDRHVWFLFSKGPDVYPSSTVFKNIISHLRKERASNEKGPELEKLFGLTGAVCAEKVRRNLDLEDEQLQKKIELIYTQPTIKTKSDDAKSAEQVEQKEQEEGRGVVLWTISGALFGFVTLLLLRTLRGKRKNEDVV